jgi:S-adenosylmethionine-diacylgycerolhomoserine-N-methlytransferase
MNLNDARILLQLIRGMPSNSNHAHRLEAFYGAQAADYDNFRERLLPGRDELMKLINPKCGEHIVELGAGTGRNPEYYSSQVPLLSQLTLVDLCPSLLIKARERWEYSANVSIVEADACTWQPDSPVDTVYFSYALTMIPDWRSALKNAIAMLRPGGRLAVVDFTVTRHQSPLARKFWEMWFKHDGVQLDINHTETLRHLLPGHKILEDQSSIPYMPGLKVPYYLFMGYKG